MDAPHSLITGWSLNEIGPAICRYLEIDFDEDWRNPDSKALWHIKVKYILEHNGLDVFLSYRGNDFPCGWAEGRYICGAHLGFNPIQLSAGELEDFQKFLDFADENEIILPPQEHFFYFDDEAFGWAGDVGDYQVFQRLNTDPADSTNRMTTEKWISLAVEKHGSLYDYSKVEYLEAQNKLIIGCKIHGEFEQRASNHIVFGCPDCYNSEVKEKMVEIPTPNCKICGDKGFAELILDPGPNPRVSPPLDCPRCNDGDWELWDRLMPSGWKNSL